MVVISWILWILFAISFVILNIFFIKGINECEKDNIEKKEKVKLELSNKLIENENKQLKLQIKKLKHQKKG